MIFRTSIKYVDHLKIKIFLRSKICFQLQISIGTYNEFFKPLPEAVSSDVPLQVEFLLIRIFSDSVSSLNISEQERAT